MKKLLSLLLVVTLVVGISIPARAIESTEPETPPQEETSPIAVVSSLDELIRAADNAKDGDKIALGKTIYINGETVSTDKEITLIRAEDFTSGNMVVIYNGILEGFRFRESSSAGVINIRPTQDSEIAVKNCIFDGGGVGEGISIIGTIDPHQVTISSCEFSDCYHHSVSAKANTNVEIEDCYIHDTYYDLGASGAVQSSGNLTLTRCTIIRNTSWANAGVMCSGSTLVIDDCQIKDNTIMSPDSGIAVDILCLDTVWSILSDGNTADAGYYEITTGEKIDLPVKERIDTAKLIYLTDEEAKDYFAPPEDVGEDTTLPGDDEGDNENPAPDDNTNIPDDGDGDDGDTPSDEVGDSDDNGNNEDAGEDENEQQPETTPPSEDEDGVQPPEDEQPPEPNTPPADDDKDTSDSDQGGTERPEKPAEDDSNSGDDYTPSMPHKPTQRPSKPSEDNEKPEEDSPAPSLVCGKAVIDASRSVVLAGYGDGDLHEDDPLTRAQLATIIYRLLTNDSIIQYGAGQAVFDDVSTDAWYYQAVNTIGHAGIVSGVGGGRYDPDGLVTWVQAITVLSRFVEPQECELKHITYTGWARPFIETAVSLGWIEDNHEFVPDALIKRGELVSLFNSVLGLYR